MVELQPSKLIVAGSSPVSRSIFHLIVKISLKQIKPIPGDFVLEHKYNEKESGFLQYLSRCSSGVERFLGKEEVTGSNPVIGSMKMLQKIELNTNIYITKIKI